MNQKILILVAGLLAGAGAVYFITKEAPHSGEPVASETEASVPAPEAHLVTAPAPVRKETMAIRPAAARAVAAAPSAWAKLAEKYGAEKTALSSKITSNLTSVINQGIELANTAARNSGSKSIAEAASKEALRSATGQLGLTEEQQKEAAAVIQAAVEKRMTAVSDLTAAMGSEPEQIMGVLLAGDAFARKEITQAEYDQLTNPTRTMLQNLAGFVGGGAGSGGTGQLLGDAETTAQLNALLTTEQQVKLSEMTTKFSQDMQTRADALNKSGLPFQPGQIPVMELERLDQSVTAVKQMTDAAKLMMDAMKGLKDSNSTPK